MFLLVSEDFTEIFCDGELFEGLALLETLARLPNGLVLIVEIRDGYPFVLSTETIEKLRYVHQTIASRQSQAA